MGEPPLPDPATPRFVRGDVLIVMGVSGSGKSTIGRRLTAALSIPSPPQSLSQSPSPYHCQYSFHDTDAFHPPANVRKMAAGQPLTDADRQPWLATIAAHIRASGRCAVYACSALRHDYRRILSAGDPSVRFVYLHSDYECILARMRARQNHFMKPCMLHSQFQTLQPPAHEEALHVDCSMPAESVVARVLDHFEPPVSNRLKP